MPGRNSKAGDPEVRRALYAVASVMHAMWRDGTSYTDRPHPDDASDGAPTAKDRKHLGAHA